MHYTFLLFPPFESDTIVPAEGNSYGLCCDHSTTPALSAGGTLEASMLIKMEIVGWLSWTGFPETTQDRWSQLPNVQHINQPAKPQSNTNPQWYTQLTQITNKQKRLKSIHFHTRLTSNSAF